MVATPDITRAAEYMIAAYGKYAWPRAAVRANDLLARGQVETSALWRLIAAEIVQIQKAREQAGDE